IAELKLQYQDQVVHVFAAFHKTLLNWRGTDEQRTKLERLLIYVEYCIQVFDERPDQWLHRGQDDLDRIHKTIYSIVLPYLSKLHVEEASFGRKASTSSYVSINTITYSDCTPYQPNYDTEEKSLSTVYSTPACIQDSSETYWHQHSALKLKYQEEVLRVIDIMHQEKLDKAGLLNLAQIENCAQIFSEEQTKDCTRSMDELDKVLHTIERVIAPYTNGHRQSCMGEEEFLSPYWLKHNELIRLYMKDIVKVENDYTVYVLYMNDPANEDKKKRVEQLLYKVRYARKVLEETIDNNNERTMEEIQQVTTCIMKYVLPYLKKAAAKEAQTKK
ncbi:hypothetical protein THRCLA_06054, partial [Thraustotheca clavata]